MPHDRPPEVEQSIPEPPAGDAREVARQAWRIAWSASNAAAGYHASMLTHLMEHEQKILGEVQALRQDFARDFANYRLALLRALESVGIRINVSPSGEHAAVTLAGGGAAMRERVASSHDIEEGLAEVTETIDERMRELQQGLRSGMPSERVKELLTEQHARIELDTKIMRLELEKSQLQLAHAQELKHLGDQKGELADSNARWLRVAFMVAGGFVTVLGALLVWALTRQVPHVG